MWFRGIKPVHIPLAGDFNNDGYTDIAYYGSCGSGKECWRVHINNKNGSFSNAGDWGADMWFKNSEFESTPIVGDFNKDGFSDIAYYGKCGNGTECWRVHINNKIGGFHNAGNWGADMWFEGSQPKNLPMAGDLNKDGFADIVYFGKCGNSTVDCWRTHVNNKVGGFLQYAGNWGGDVWFGDCGEIGECKDVSIQSDNKIASGLSTESRARKMAIKDWEEKVKNLYGKAYAN